MTGFVAWHALCLHRMLTCHRCHIHYWMTSTLRNAYLTNLAAGRKVCKAVRQLADVSRPADDHYAFAAAAGLMAC